MRIRKTKKVLYIRVYNIFSPPYCTHVFTPVLRFSPLYHPYISLPLHPAFTPSLRCTLLNHPSLHFTSFPYIFNDFPQTSIIAFLTLFFKVFNLQGSVPNTSAGSWFQSWMVHSQRNISLYPSFASNSKFSVHDLPCSDGVAVLYNMCELRAPLCHQVILQWEYFVWWKMWWFCVATGRCGSEIVDCVDWGEWIVMAELERILTWAWNCCETLYNARAVQLFGGLRNWERKCAVQSRRNCTGRAG